MTSEPATASVDAVCVVERVRKGYYHRTAIDKRPRTGRVTVGTLGLEGDRQVDSTHGGPDAAVYVYGAADAALWTPRLGRDVEPGLLGENLRVSGIDVSGALIGQRWKVGDVLLEVRGPRRPCRNLSMHVGVDDFHLELNASGRVGAMCAVIETGTVGAGDAVVALPPPEHAVSVETFVTGFDAAQAQRLLDSGVHLTAPVRNKARRVLRRAAAG